jgi:hypothetical protein
MAEIREWVVEKLVGHRFGAYKIGGHGRIRCQSLSIISRW